MIRFGTLLAAFLAASTALAEPACPPETTPLADFGNTISGISLAPDGYARNLATSDGSPALREAAARAKILDVPFRVQDGPTCGLYALGMVMDYWNRKDPANETAWVQPGDRTRADSHTLPATDSRLIFDEAKRNGYFAESLRIVGREGGMFVADELGRLATKFGYEYDLIENAGIRELEDVLGRGHPALVGFDVDHDGLPASLDGKRAHWAVIVGSFEHEGEKYFVAQHGWEAKHYLFNARDLEKSMADIQPTLGPKIVEVFP